MLGCRPRQVNLASVEDGRPAAVVSTDVVERFDPDGSETQPKTIYLDL
jgi:hypothetical protein